MRPRYSAQIAASALPCGDRLDCPDRAAWSPSKSNRRDSENAMLQGRSLCDKLIQRSFEQLVSTYGLRTAQITDLRVQPRLQKYFHSRLTQITSISRAVSSLWRGVSRSSRTRDGMRWTRQRWARDVIAGRVGERPVSDRTARRRTTIAADGKAVWSWHPLLVLNSRRLSRPDRA
jgi:hypothetical protein